MTTVTYQLTVTLPTSDEFLASYPKFRQLVNGRGRFVFDRIVSAEGFVRALVAQRDLGLPAVAGIAEYVYTEVQRSDPELWSDELKRYIGAVTCVLMEANGFEKTSTSRAVPHQAFTVARMYRVRQSV